MGAACALLPAARAATPSLDAALKALSARTHLNILYVSGVVADLPAAPVPEGLAPPAALRRLLAGTGLEAEFLSPTTVRIRQRRVRRAAEPAPALAPAAPEPAVRGLEELPEGIVVTATKNSALQERVPLSVYVLGREDLEQGGMTSIADIAAASPSLDYQFVSAYGPGELTGTVIRGIGSNKGSPTTGIYLGDMPLQMPQNPFRAPYPIAFDMQRVELLRGPQGTLFGANAMGGALRYVPETASLVDRQVAVRAQGAFTEQGAAAERLEGVWAAPLVEGLAGARLAVAQIGQPGYVDHVSPFDGRVTDPHDNRATARLLHLALTLAPAPALRIEPDFTYQATHLHDSPVFYLPGATAQPDPTFAAGRDFSNGRLLRQPLDERFWVGTLRFTGDWQRLHLVSSTSYLDRSNSTVVDETNGACLAFFGGCGNPLGPAYPADASQAVPTDLTQHQGLLTSELRLSGEAGRLSWLAGAFYSNLHTEGMRNTYLAAAPQVSGVFQQTWFVIHSRAAFGQLRYRLAPEWSVSIGTRIGQQAGESTGIEAGFANPSPPFSHSSNPWAAQKSDPRFALEYQPRNGDFYYASMAKGTRQGGGNGASPCHGFVPPASYGSDAVWNYELGARLRLLGDHLRLSGTLFHLRWNGVQEPILDACDETYFANAGSAISQGIDLDAEYATRGWNLQLALSYLDAHYTRTLFDATGHIVVRAGDVLGGYPAVASPWSGRLALRRRWPSGLYAGSQLVFQSRNQGPFTGQDPLAAEPLPPYVKADPGAARLGAQVGWQFGPWDARLAVDNLTGHQPTLQGAADAAGYTPLYGYTWAPRIWRLSLSWQR